jgi:short-subunit dehydrogenase
MGYTVFALDKLVKQPEENIIPIEFDITNSKSIENAFNLISKKTEKLDALIHFAGIYALNSLIEIPESEFKRIFEINLFGAYLVNKTFKPLLSKGSKIIITTSELAPLKPLPFTGIYAITKSALDNYAYSLKMELQMLDISVSVLRAGAVSTGMLGVSTTALDNFVEKTTIYKCNATRFKKVVDSVESKCVSPEKIANKVYKIISKKRPKFAYKINRNKLLLLLNALPQGLQFGIIKQIIKSPKKDK